MRNDYVVLEHIARRFFVCLIFFYIRCGLGAVLQLYSVANFEHFLGGVLKNDVMFSKVLVLFL